MAEFQSVIKKMRRLCNTHKDDCMACDMYKMCIKVCHEASDDQIAEAEAIIVKWADENPESRYPTWEEWQDTNFPDAAHNVCPRAYMTSERWPCTGRVCAECRTHEIPADIAKKLGVELIKEAT